MLKTTLLLVTIFALSQSIHASDRLTNFNCVGNRGHQSEFLFKILEDANSGEFRSWVISSDVKFSEASVLSRSTDENFVATGWLPNLGQDFSKLTYYATIQNSNSSLSGPVPGVIEVRGYGREPRETIEPALNPMVCCASGYPLNSQVGTSCEKNRVKGRLALTKEFKEVFGKQISPEVLHQILKF